MKHWRIILGGLGLLLLAAAFVMIRGGFGEVLPALGADGDSIPRTVEESELPNLLHAGERTPATHPVRLQVLDCQGDPVANEACQIRVGNVSLSFGTDEQGRCSFLCPVDLAEFELSTGDPPHVVRAVLAQDPAPSIHFLPSIRGRLRFPTGSRPCRALVLFLPTHPISAANVDAESAIASTDARTVLTEVDGSFSLCALEPGAWTIFCGSPGLYSKPVDFVLAANESRVVDVELRYLVGCAYRLTDPDSAELMLAGSTSPLSTRTQATLPRELRESGWREEALVTPSMVLAGVPGPIIQERTSGVLHLFGGTEPLPHGASIEIDATAAGYLRLRTRLLLVSSEEISQFIALPLQPLGRRTSLIIQWVGANPCVDEQTSNLGSPLLLRLRPIGPERAPSFDLVLKPSSMEPQKIDNVPAGVYSAVLRGIASEVSGLRAGDHLELRADEPTVLTLDLGDTSCVEFVPTDSSGSLFSGRMEVRILLERTARGRAYDSVIFRRPPYLLPFVSHGEKSFRIIPFGFESVELGLQVSAGSQRYSVPVALR